MSDTEYTYYTYIYIPNMFNIYTYMYHAHVCLVGILLLELEGVGILELDGVWMRLVLALAGRLPVDLAWPLEAWAGTLEDDEEPPVVY